MTFDVASTKKYEKDVSIAKKRGLPIDKLVEVVGKLASGETLPPALKDHPLKGEFRGKRECHINPDWLLIYQKDTVLRLITLVRTGTHSDLFKK